MLDCLICIIEEPHLQQSWHHAVAQDDGLQLALDVITGSAFTFYGLMVSALFFSS
jgi:hypothetical protein